MPVKSKDPGYPMWPELTQLRKGTLWLICLLIVFAGAGSSSVRVQGSDWKGKEVDLSLSYGSTDSALTDRLRRAVLVVKGRVVNIHPLDRGRSEPISEHSPNWWQATVKVAAVYKGESKDKLIAVLFPNSKDIAWYKSPKFKSGETGIFILQKEPVEKSGTQIQGFTALDPVDFRPVSERHRLRQLLREIH